MTASSTESPKAFISYSHDSPEHINRVLELADRLRAGGVDCRLDQYETSPPEGWPKWTNRQIMPASPKGRIILTTRAQATGGIANVEVRKMEEDEGALFLLRRAKLLSENETLDDTSDAVSTLRTQTVRTPENSPEKLTDSRSYSTRPEPSSKRHLRVPPNTSNSTENRAHISEASAANSPQTRTCNRR